MYLFLNSYLIKHQFNDKIRGLNIRNWNINKQSRNNKGNSAPEVTCTHIDLSVHEYQQLRSDHDVEEQEYQQLRLDHDLEEL